TLQKSAESAAQSGAIFVAGLRRPVFIPPHTRSPRIVLIPEKRAGAFHVASLQTPTHCIHYHRDQESSLVRLDLGLHLDGGQTFDQFLGPQSAGSHRAQMNSICHTIFRDKNEARALECETDKKFDVWRV